MITQAMRPVDVLTRGIAQFAGGDLNTQVDIHSGDEFELLGDNFNHMVLNINQLLQEIRLILTENLPKQMSKQNYRNQQRSK